MGSPLCPLFASVFMSNFEREHRSRYVNDVFATLGKKKQAEKILAFLNNQHPNIRFTIEHEKNKKLPFFDDCVTRSQQVRYNCLPQEDVHCFVSSLDKPNCEKIRRVELQKL